MMEAIDNKIKLRCQGFPPLELVVQIMEADANFPFEINPVPPEINRKLLADFTGERTGFIQIGPKNWVFPAKHQQFAAKFYNFEVRPDDIWVVTFPRSGTTLTQELVWLLANNLDYETAGKISQLARFPYFESGCVHEELKAEIKALHPEKQKFHEMLSKSILQVLQEQSGRRFIKTHLPFSLLPPNLLDTCKVVYVARNPKDVAVSFYHFNRLMKTLGYVGDFKTFWDYFERSLLLCSPYWDHVAEGWKNRHHPNLFFQFYEDMNADLCATIQKIGNFLDKKMTSEQVERLADHLDIENFRKNASVNFNVVKEAGLTNSGEADFIRKGKVGDWHAEFDEELNERADKWIEENLRKTDMKFPIKLQK